MQATQAGESRINYFCTTVTTSPDGSILKEDRYILAWGLRGSQSILVGRIWQQECLEEAVYTLGDQEATIEGQA